MSQARLPDGSRIVDARRASPDAVLRGFVSLDGAINELRAYKTNDGVMSELRSLDGGSLGRSDADELLRRIASALLNKSLLWELPAGSFASALRAVPSTASDSPKPATSRGGTTVRASLFTGGTTFRKAEPPKKPKVTPKLALEYAVVLLRSPDATRVECAFEQDPAAPAYDKGLRLSIKGAGDVEAYADEALITKLDLSAAVSGKVYLKGVKAGLFELTLDVEEDPRFERGEPAKAAMAVVELNLGLHKQDVGAIGRLQANPDQDPVSKYHDDLKALKLPEQIEVTEAEKADGTRWLHAQRGGSHARAKLLLRKLDAALWPAGCDDYRITLEAKEPKVASYDVEWDGAPLPRPHAFKVSALKAADKTLWVEGLEASAALGDVRLSLGLDRSPGGLDKKPKREGDVARLTVVEITEVKVDYTAPSGEATAYEPKGDFYINLKPDPDGREVTLSASLKPPLADIPVHFMLAPDENNGKALPKAWTWKNIDPAVKHRDRVGRSNLLHFRSLTDASGVAKTNVFLSRFGGDIFHPAGYISQDPHLSLYVRGVPELQKRVPILATTPITVWRKFWYQRVEVEGFSFPDFSSVVGKWGAVKAVMENGGNLFFSRAAVSNLGVPALYPRYMMEVGGGTNPALVVSDTTKGSFFSGISPERDKPVKIPILVCDFQWDPDGDTQKWGSPNIPIADFPVTMSLNKKILSPPLQGGNLLRAGLWKAKAFDTSTQTYRLLGSGLILDQDVWIDPQRSHLNDASLRRPSASLTHPDATHIEIQGVVLKAARKSLGSYDPNSKDILASFDPAQVSDYPNTVAHEIGHAFQQACEPGTQPLGAPNHPHPDVYYFEPWHCIWRRDKCLMYRSGPVAGTLGQFCPECQPYVVSVDMSHLL